MSLPSSCESATDYFSKMLKFSKRNQHLYNYPNTDVLIENVLEKINVSDSVETLERDFDLHTVLELQSITEQVQNLTTSHKRRFYEVDMECSGTVPLAVKKIHEINCLSQEIDRNCRKVGCDTIVDLGCGLGYLDELLFKKYNYKILGLEHSKNFVKGAEKRQSSYHRESIDNVKYVQHFVDDSSSVAIDELLKKHFPESATVCIVGLHACADLTVHAMNIFLKMDKAKCLILMPCCYHKMSLKPNLDTNKLDEKCENIDGTESETQNRHHAGKFRDAEQNPDVINCDENEVELNKVNIDGTKQDTQNRQRFAKSRHSLRNPEVINSERNVVHLNTANIDDTGTNSETQRRQNADKFRDTEQNPDVIKSEENEVELNTTNIDGTKSETENRQNARKFRDSLRNPKVINSERNVVDLNTANIDDTGTNSETQRRQNADKFRDTEQNPDVIKSEENEVESNTTNIDGTKSETGNRQNARKLRDSVEKPEVINSEENEVEFNTTNIDDGTNSETQNRQNAEKFGDAVHADEINSEGEKIEFIKRNKRQYFNNFPLSESLKAVYAINGAAGYLRIPFLRLASQPSSTDEDMDTLVFRLIARAVLQLYCHKNRLRLVKKKRRAIKLSSQTGDFSKYLQDATLGYTIQCNKKKCFISETSSKSACKCDTDFKIEQLMSMWKDIWCDLTVKKAAILILLQRHLQPMFENLVLFDRIQFLKENRIEYCEFVKIVDEKVSPRCLALVTVK